MERVDLTHQFGNNLIINLTLKSELGVGVDITGYTVYFTIKQKLEDFDSRVILKKTITEHTDAQHGQTQIICSPNEMRLTGSYFYDIRFDSSNQGVVQTYAWGTITFNDVVNKT